MRHASKHGSSRKNKKIRINIISFIGLLIIGAVVFSTLVVFQPEIEQKAATNDLIYVPIVNSSIIQGYPVVELSGRVQSEGSITLIAQTDGDVTSPNYQLKPGTYFTKGSQLLSIDDKSARANYSQRLVNLAQAKQAYALEQQMASLAEDTWQNEFQGKVISDLAARKLQLETAQANVISAQDAVSKAEYALLSTNVTAPFNGYIADTFIENHQYVTPGSRLLQIYPTEYYIIPVPINLDQLVTLQLPLVFNEEFGAIDILLSANVAGIEQTWPGKIIRSDNRLDPVTRVTTLSVAVTSPLDTNIHQHPLVPGMFVKVVLTGTRPEPIVAIPQSALQQNNKVYRLSADNKLLVETVSIIDYKTSEPLPEGYVMVTGLSTTKNLINQTMTNIVSGTLLEPLQ